MEKRIDLPLIFDVGAHHGDDTAFYLAKGFRVLAVEADPGHCAGLSRRFEAEIIELRCEVVASAVGVPGVSGLATFYANESKDDWGTCSVDYRQRNDARGAPSVEIKVPVVDMKNLFDRYGTPYYLKIDVEGSDTLCIQQLVGLASLPRYLSAEVPLNHPVLIEEMLTAIEALGYQDFKLVNQACHRQTHCPSPAREGQYVDWNFHGHSSGLFGRELPGIWDSAARVHDKLRRLAAERKRWKQEGALGRTMFGRLYRQARSALGRPIGWYDLHARLPAK